MPDAVCQTAISHIPSARRPSATLNGRCRLNWSEYEGKAWERVYLLPDMHLPPSLVSRFTYTLLLVFKLSGRRRLADTVSGRWHLADTVSSRRCLADTVCLIQSCGHRNARRRLPDSLAKSRLECSVWQTAPGRQCLADAVCLIPSCRHCLPDATSTRQSGRGVCQTFWQRTVWQTASGGQCLADGVCQAALCQTVWQTPRLADTVSSRQCLVDAVCLIPS